MTLREFISSIKKYMPEATELEIVAYFNNAYNDLISQDVSDWIYMNELDYRFPYPILHYVSVPPPAATEPPPDGEGVDEWWKDWNNDDMDSLVYDLSTDFLYDTDINNIDLKLYASIAPDRDDQDLEPSIVIKPRKVANIFTFKTAETLSDFEDIFRPANVENTMYSKYEFVKVPFKTEPSDTFRVNPRVTFFVPPKKFKVPFFVEFYYKPTAALSLSSPILIDLDKWFNELKDGTVGYYEDLVQGSSEKLDRFKASWIRKYKKEANSTVDRRESTRYPTRYV